MSPHALLTAFAIGFVAGFVFAIACLIGAIWLADPHGNAGERE